MTLAYNTELPDHVRGALTYGMQTRFRTTFNTEVRKGVSRQVATRRAWLAVNKKLPTGASKEEYIHDFVNSDDPRFEGKSKKERIRMALGAFYNKAAPKTLYVCRYVQNASDIIKWAKGQGFKTVLKPEDLHVTIAHSRQPVDWMKADPIWSMDSEGNVTIPPGGPRLVEPLGDKGAVVLMFKDYSLQSRWEQFKNIGAQWDYQGYQPHITITWDAGDVDLSKIEPYNGKIVLGPEVFAEVDNNWADNLVEKIRTEQRPADYAELLYKAVTISQPDGGGNPYHDMRGRFSTGPGSGGAKHLATHIAAASVSSVASHAAVSGFDWLAGDDKSAKASKELHSSSETAHAVNIDTAKQVAKVMLAIGIEVAATTAWGKLVQATLPFLTGPGKQLALAVVQVAVKKAGGSSAILSKAVSAAYHATTTPSGLRFIRKVDEQPLTKDDLVAFQLHRLQMLLEVMDPSDLAAQRAEEFLKVKDPELLKNLLNDLEDAGLVDYFNTVDDHALDARVVKVDKSLGLVFGWAIVCKQAGKDYYDLNIDNNGKRVPEHIPESAMLEAASSFMEHHRVAKEMHEGEQQGTVVFAFPMTTDIAKSLGIETNTTGLLIAMKPNKEMLGRFSSGELTGFSIGGSRVKSREYEDS